MPSNKQSPPRELPAAAAANQEILCKSAPASARPWILTAAAAHLAIVLLCLSSTGRQSDLATEMLGGLSPYATTLNLRHEARPLAVSDDRLLERPITVTFGRDIVSGPPALDTAPVGTAASEELRWIDGSLTNGGRLSRFRQRRYLAQLAMLIEAESEAGVSRVIEAMRRDLATRVPAAALGQIVIERGSIVPSASGEATAVPSDPPNDIVLRADLVELKNGRLGILPQVEPLRTAPVQNPASPPQAR